MRHLLFIALVAGAATAARAQSTQFRQIFTSDSIIPASAETSPDGKWIVIARTEGSLASLWIAPANGGSPTRLTSIGYSDMQPAWFASGDRIAFMSTRPNRNGGRQHYLMTLGIDPATGRAVGAPRQVSSEPVQQNARPRASKDGRWMLYITGAPPEPAMLRIVPANGGSARTVATGTHPMNAVTFSPDGRFVYYGQQAGVGGKPCRGDGWGCASFTIMRVAIAGGAPVQVARESHRIRVLAADPRYVQHQVVASNSMSSTGTWELRDSTGRALGRIEFPDDVQHSSFTGDGWGIVGINRVQHRAIRLVSVTGGAMRNVSTTDRRWPEAWMPDGSAIITDREENGRIVIEVTALDGKAVSQHQLPASAQSSGWNTSFGPWFTYQPGALGLTAINVVTGQTKEISRNTVCCLQGRGGMEQDGARFVLSEDDDIQQTYKTSDPTTGAVSILRTFKKGGARRRNTMANGSRLAWLEERGDSVDLMVSDNASAPIRKLMSARVPYQGAGETMAWNWKGDRIALCGDATGAHGSLTIVDVQTSDRQVIPLTGATDCWAPQWQPDDSGLVLIVTMNRAENPPDLAYLSLKPGAKLSVITADEPYDLWNYITSPDGKYVTYAVNLPVSRASISIASFKSLVNGTR